MTPNTPVLELYVRLFVAESDVDEILLLNVFQSDDESRPLFRDPAVGKFHVTVFPDAVIVKSVPVVDVANSCVAPVCVCPTGPRAVIAVVR